MEYFVLFIFLNKGDRSRLFLAITFGISGVMVLTDSMLSITQANPYGEALSITKIVMGFASLFMLYLYPIEVGGLLLRVQCYHKIGTISRYHSAIIPPFLCTIQLVEQSR